MDKFLSSGRALLKIHDGCNNFCTYCIVPYLKGPSKSVIIPSIIKQVNSYKPKEAILTAISSELYGLDTGESLMDLIDAVLKKTNVDRLSFGSLSPLSINKEFIDFYKKIKSDRFVSFFHIPIQSGSDKILSLMKRPYKLKDVLSSMNKLKKINANAFISTDIIVGFLDETDKDFNVTYNFLKKAPISRFHVFRFSKREPTAAYYMAKRQKEPSENTKKERSRRLRTLSDYKFNNFKKSLIGYTSKALVLDKRVNDLWECLLDNQVPVYVSSSKVKGGTIVRTTVHDFKKGRLFGKIL